MKNLIKILVSGPLLNKNGFYISYYGKNKGKVYPEITAYALSILTILYNRTGNEIFLNLAEKSANALITIARRNNGGIPGYDTKILYTFDTGIYISGLMDLYNITKKKKYFIEAKRSSDWLMKFCDGEKFLATNSKRNYSWDLMPSIHLTKLSIPLLKIWKKTKVKEYLKVVINLLDWGKKLQTKNGRFMMNQKIKMTMLHPHCYALEGYAYAYHILKNEEYMNIVKKGLSWMTSIQNRNGSFPRWYPLPPSQNFKQKIKNLIIKEYPFDAPSQFIRLCKILGYYKKQCLRSEGFILKNCFNEGLPLVKRKLFGFLPIKNKKEVWSWPTIFYLHSKLINFGDKNKLGEIF